MHKVKNKLQIDQECIKIEYANDGLVYVPIDRLSKIHKLISAGKKVPVIASLGTNRWDYQKRKAKESAQKIVKEMIDFHASKSQDRGFLYDPNDQFYYALVSTFPFIETEDQTSSIQATIADMEKPNPMDRLICGDVGFGKTEVALRATIKAIASGKQVLLLAPTTILADQHFISTKLRFDPLGARVELLSRFKTKKEQLNILSLMQSGQVDIVIGTHRLLSDDIHIKDLGLLIIDEEHRFGVKHKEKIRLLKQNVDVLTLSATPIPRTLQQALVGYRDISRITTPPKTRKPIRTFVEFFHWDIIKKTLNYEISRNGQAYFLHNNITELPFYYNKIKDLFPDRAIAIAHSQTPSRELEKIVLSYFNGDIDILICTTIIESGLDVSNANTIIINNAHKFGLSQLYQIRGRVGRSYRQAYCYLMLPLKQSFGSDALQRLKAIEQFTSLGSGYDIATKDLEIRGAGNLFGYQQSGHISSVGFELYCSLLQEAFDESSGRASKQIEPTRIIIDKPTLLESDYVPLAQDRLYFYQRLAETNNQEHVKDLELELIDRFGPLPNSAGRLLVATRYRVALSGSSVSHLYLKTKKVAVSLRAPSPFKSTEALIDAVSSFVENNSLRFNLSVQPNSRLELNIHSESREESCRMAEWLVSLFSI
jgi:transcription-repair coupling factor (superfamily II helicase)